jgi:hypothetical protein
MGMFSTTKTGYWTSLYWPVMENHSKHTGSNSWLRGKWLGSSVNTYQDKPHSPQKCTPPQYKDKKTLWDQSTLYRAGFGHCSPDPWSIMVCCSSTLRSPVTGRQSGKFSDSINSSITYAIFASESPISRRSAKECRKLNWCQKGGWNSPTLSILHRTFASSLGSSPEEGETIDETTNIGMAWIPSRWGHLV